MSDPVDHALQAWRAALEDERQRQSRLGPAITVGENLRRRVALEQLARKTLMSTAVAGGSERAFQFRMLAAAEVRAIDQTNLDYVKSVLPADGWFRKSRDGDQVGRDAWLIVQHAPDDRAFQRQVLAAMEPLVKIGEARGADYALLYDRLEMYEGRPQRYGSQATCADGGWALHAIEDPDQIDERRRSVGLTQPISEYAKQLGVGGAC